LKNKTGYWKVDSQKGKQIYSHRMSVVEPVFGNITSNKRLKQFSLRGKTKVNAQWKLFCLIQNIEKLVNYGHKESVIGAKEPQKNRIKQPIG